MFTILFNAGLGAVALFAVLLVVNRRAAMSLIPWVRAGAGSAVSAVTGTNLVGQLQEAVKQATEKVAKGRQGLARIGGLKRGLERQLKDLRTEETQWVLKITQAQTHGDPNGTLQGYAMQLSTCREQIALNQAQYEEISAQFDDYSQDILDGDLAIREAQTKAKTAQARLEMSESQRAIAEFANSYNPNAITGELATAMQQVEDKINLNLGSADAAQVGQEQRRGERRDRAMLRQAQADAVLAEFNIPKPAIPVESRPVASLGGPSSN